MVRDRFNVRVRVDSFMDALLVFLRAQNHSMLTTAGRINTCKLKRWSYLIIVTILLR